MIAYPEHEKMRAVQDQAETIGAFLEWLSRSHSICRWRDAGNNGKADIVPATPADLERIGEEWGRYSWEVMNARERGIRNPEYESWPEGYEPDYTSINARLADYFGIDLETIEEEKRAMLDRLRAAAL